jgi:FemAB-related protein (PEP-CTERM system-associated)
MVIGLEVRSIKKSDEKAWDQYVSNSNTSTFYHQIGWKNVIEKTYGHKSYYLIAEEDEHIRGILPLTLMQSRIFGNKLVSVPFGPYGGPCADNEIIEKALVAESKRLAVQLNVEYLELRANLNKDKFYDGLISNSRYLASFLELDSDPNTVLMEKLKRNKRKNIYKSQQMQLSYKWTNETDDFYELFVSNMKDLGSPAHSQNFFNNIIFEFPESSKILVVIKDDKVIYSAFYLFFKETMINSWSSTLQIYRQHFPTDFGIWNAIKYGCENGYKYYDFGRSQKGSTNLEFKRRWSCESKELNYQYYLNKKKTAPNTTSSNPKRKTFARYWSKTPYFVVKSVGQLIRKNMP